MMKTQIRALTDVQQGRLSPQRLVGTRTALRHSFFDKKYFESPRVDLAACVPPQCERVLSVGCTDGATEAYLRERGHDVYAVPVDAVVGSCAAARGIHVLPPNLDKALDLVGDNRFGCIVFPHVLQHFHDPVAVVKRCASCLDNGGYLVAAVPNHEHISVTRKRLSGKSHFADLRFIHDYERSRIRFSSRGAVRRWLRESGFKTVDLAMSDLRLTATRRFPAIFGFNGESNNERPLLGVLTRVGSGILGGFFAMTIIARATPRTPDTIA
ncbi:MAG: methyltransferase domain-containing protein [Chitinivibrionales bacterium]|nr:methyltransferase domain-containing protein [Chitinivibrionales bacterium]